MAEINDDELAFSGPGALAHLIKSRELAPRELAELFLRRIEALDPGLNAFRIVLAERALSEASRAGDAPARGRDGPLAGVPVAVKDDLPVAGQLMTWGSRSLGPVQRRDAEAVRRLRAAGAIPIGITNVPELMIFPWTATDANGVTRNPWDPSRTPGGSSGGSAAAVAAGMVPVATGSDGGGSIRIPAACCGLVGMKPTRGRVSTQPASEGWLGLSVYGALTRTVRDSALMLDVMQGATPLDRHSAPAPDRSFVEAAEAAPGRLRIAVSRKIPAGLIAKLSVDQRKAWERTGRLLEELGHQVDERDPDYGWSALEFTQTYLRGIHEDFVKLPDRSLSERSTRQMAAVGRWLVSESRCEKVLAKRPVTTARVLELWNEFDVLLTPGLASTAIAAEGGYGRPALMAFDRAGRFTPWTPMFNLTGQPAIALPAGWGADGLPLSVQLVGRPGQEELLYSLAGQLEVARPWADRRPPLRQV
ncbi:MAG: amidase family protein [Solirubrobacteraceae bacterium]